MSEKLNRRDALKAVVAAGTMAIVEGAGAQAPEQSLLAGSTPVEAGITHVSPRTVRITILPVLNGKPEPLAPDGALVERQWSAPLATIRSLPAARTFRSGDLTISISPRPLAIQIKTTTGRVVQQLAFDDDSSGLLFELGQGHLFGLGLVVVIDHDNRRGRGRLRIGSH